VLDTARVTTPPEHLLEFLRRYGVALCLAGESVSRIPEEMSALADAYGVGHIECLVIPTGVFVKVPSAGGMLVDFANADGPPLRLDQVDSLYQLIDRVKAAPIPPAEGIAAIGRILTAAPRYSALVTVLGHAVLTVGIGLLLVRDERALLSLALLGLLVGVLRLVADRVQVLSLALPVAAALLVTLLAYRFSADLGADPNTLLIPPLATFLPGAALTLGAQELATRSIISGAGRLVSGVYMLLLLTFGIYAGAQIAGTPAQVTGSAATPDWWAPWLGVLVFGIGMALNASAPLRAVPWLLLTLYAAFTAQFLGGLLAGGVFSAFAGGLVVVPMAYLVQRWGGPPAQVSFLPPFWLLVPGALGLAGVSGLIALGPGRTGDLMTALLTVVAVALGVLVGSSLMANVTATSRLATSRSI
jgi:uncharacterized membrane protein YjjP (DUF1212 family)